MNKETDYCDLGLTKKFTIQTSLECKISIPILAAKDSSYFHILKINNEKEYDHICSVMESLV